MKMEVASEEALMQWREKFIKWSCECNNVHSKSQNHDFQNSPSESRKSMKLETSLTINSAN